MSVVVALRPLTAKDQRLLGGCAVLTVVAGVLHYAALEPAIGSLGISQAFAGLVIAAIAGNPVENVVGIQFAARNRADYALSVILQAHCGPRSCWPQ